MTFLTFLLALNLFTNVNPFGFHQKSISRKRLSLSANVAILSLPFSEFAGKIVADLFTRRRIVDLLI
jgi:hypothetical protein